MSTDEHTIENCAHWDEPGAMPLAHVVTILRGIRRRIDANEMSIEQVKDVLGGFANGIEAERYSLLAAPSIVADAERFLSDAAATPGASDGE